MPNIIVLTNKTNAGDNSAAIAIAASFKDKSRESSIVQFDISESYQLNAARILIEKSQDESVIIGSGSHMLEPMRILKAGNDSKVVSCFASHQIPLAIEEYKDDLDIISFPKHVISEKDRVNFGSKLVETVGVAHNLTLADLKAEYEKRKDKIPLIEGKKYIFAILGGDAELPQKTQDGKSSYKYYTEKEAREFGKYLASEVSKNEDLFLFVTNGGRTGMMNPTTGEKLNTHRDINPETKEKIDYKLDHVSKAFMEEVTKHGLVEDKNFKFYDFKFLERGVDSVYKAIFGFLLESKGQVKVLVPGESTSIISEGRDMLPEGSVIIVLNDAMNDSHLDYVKSVAEVGNTKVISSKGEEQNLISTEKLPTLIDTESSRAKEVIANKISKIVDARTPSSSVAAGEVNNLLGKGVSVNI